MYTDSEFLKYEKMYISESMKFGMFYFYSFIYIFWLRCAACGNLVPGPGIEPMPRALEAQNLNHWTTREVPGMFYF